MYVMNISDVNRNYDSFMFKKRDCSKSVESYQIMQSQCCSGGKVYSKRIVLYVYASSMSMDICRSSDRVILERSRNFETEAHGIHK